MPPAAILACLDDLGWSTRELARQCSVSESSARQWISGRLEMPEPLAVWLAARAAAARATPAPGRAE